MTGLHGKPQTFTVVPGPSPLPVNAICVPPPKDPCPVAPLALKVVDIDTLPDAYPLPVTKTSTFCDPEGGLQVADIDVRDEAETVHATLPTVILISLIVVDRPEPVTVTVVPDTVALEIDGVRPALKVNPHRELFVQVYVFTCVIVSN